RRQKALLEIERDEEKASALILGGKVNEGIKLYDQVISRIKTYSTPRQVASTSRRAGETLFNSNPDDEDLGPQVLSTAIRFLTQAQEIGAKTHGAIWQIEMGLLLERAYAKAKQPVQAEEIYKQTVALAKKNNAKELEHQLHIERLDAIRGLPDEE